MLPLLKINTSRINEMKSGAQELERWLVDLMQQGLVSIEQDQERFWEEIARRMVNTKLDGLAKRIRTLKTPMDNQSEWQERVLREVSRLYLIARGIQQLDQQTAAQQYELLRIGGARINKEALLQEKGVSDTWLIIAQEFGHEEQLNYRRCWLYGEKSRQLALVLDFLWNSTNFFPEYEFGALYKGEVIYYPGATPRRAFFKDPAPFKGTFQGKGGMNTLTGLTRSFSQKLQQNPWLESLPCLLNDINVRYTHGQFLIADIHSNSLPIRNRSKGYWKLIGLSMDHPVSLFGHWTGHDFLPVSALALNRLIAI